MFNFLKKKSETEKLNLLYKKLMEEAYKLSHTDRKAGDAKFAEAEEIAARIEVLSKKSKN
jgi:hypothetical protein